MAEIKPGCEAWSAQGSGANADIGFLLIHGYSGSPAGMRPWAQDLAERGFTVELPLLPGHGTHYKDVSRITWQDMAREVVRGFERLRARSRVCIAAGLSVGGLLALRLAQTRGHDLGGIIAVNPHLFTSHPLTPFMPVLKYVVPFFPGIINDIAKPDMDELGYEKLGLRGLSSVHALQRQVRPRLGDITVPTLLFSSREDHVVSPACGEEIAAKIGSGDFEHIWLERSYHVATLDYDYPIILEHSVKFAERIGHTSA